MCVFVVRERACVLVRWRCGCLVVCLLFASVGVLMCLRPGVLV